MGRSPCCEKIGMRKGPWSAEEDQILISHIQRRGHSNWRALPKLAGLMRCGKSCRLRWMNYLRPDIKRGNFTKEEEDTVIALHKMLGNRWSAIAAKLPGRTDNEIKNVWHTHIKKRLENERNTRSSSSSCSSLASDKEEEEEEHYNESMNQQQLVDDHHADPAVAVTSTDLQQYHHSNFDDQNGVHLSNVYNINGAVSGKKEEEEDVYCGLSRMERLLEVDECSYKWLEADQKPTAIQNNIIDSCVNISRESPSDEESIFISSILLNDGGIVDDGGGVDFWLRLLRVVGDSPTIA